MDISQLDAGPILEIQILYLILWQFLTWSCEGFPNVMWMWVILEKSQIGVKHWILYFLIAVVRQVDYI